MSTFNDGSGQERDADGNTRLGWRDIERVAAYMLKGTGGENKNIFDVLVTPDINPYMRYGISVKSKGLTTKALNELSSHGRVYMELCNSPAKLWKPLIDRGFRETDFTERRHAREIGPIILQTVESWHNEYAHNFGTYVPGCRLDLQKSIYLTVSYDGARGENRQYQIHSFPLQFASGIIWEYSSDRCLRGFDPDYPKETLFDWYGLSGGQLKYYPRASEALYATPRFNLLMPKTVTLADKASSYFPDDWTRATSRI